MVTGGGGVDVGEVAPAIARGQELAPHPRLPLEKRHLIVGILRGCKGGDHAAGAAADDQYLHALVSLLAVGTVPVSHLV